MVPGLRKTPGIGIKVSVVHFFNVIGLSDRYFVLYGYFISGLHFVLFYGTLGLKVAEVFVFLLRLFDYWWSVGTVYIDSSYLPVDIVIKSPIIFILYAIIAVIVTY